MTDTKPRNVKISEKLASSAVIEDQGEEGDVEEEGAVTEEEIERDEMPPIPVPLDTSADVVDGIVEPKSRVSNGTMDITQATPKRRRTLEESASFNTSDRKSKNCATFYFKHLDTDSEVDSGAQNEESPIGVDDSSEEEWTYTASPNENYEARYEQKKSNVVVRLDFGESPIIERIENVEFKRKTTLKSNELLVNGKDKVIVEEEDVKFVQEEERKEVKIEKHRCERNESDDEAKNNIQKLILEVEKLVREDARSGVSKNLPPLIFEGQGQSDNYRAKYARIKEWLKLNSTHVHETRSTLQVNTRKSLLLLV